MDKNTITGFVLIGIVLFAFSWFNRPTPEQIEAQRRYQDSLAQIELAQQMELAQKEQQAAMLQDSINHLHPAKIDCLDNNGKSKFLQEQLNRNNKEKL